MKKVIFYIFLLLTLTTPVFADDSIDIDEAETSILYETSIVSSNEPIINSKNVIVLDRKTLLPLYEKDACSKVSIASTTKILTCIIALENCSLNEIVTVSKKAATISGSTLGLSSNMKLSMNDLLYGLMLRSGNDCAIAIAEHISGSIENFSILMNQKASSLGLTNSNFVTPHGLDEPNHFSTAYELAIITDYALKNPKFLEIVSSKTYTILLNGVSHTLSNTNELLGTTPGVYGVKTGFTFNAGRCLVTACKRNDLDIIVVVLGADTKRIRTKDSLNLINYIFNTYQYVNIENTLKCSFNDYLSYFENSYYLEKTTDKPILELSTIDNYIFPLSDTDSLNLHTQIYTLDLFNSNIKSGSVVGQLYLYCKDKLLCKIDITLKHQLIKNNWKYYFKNIFKYYK